MFSVLSCKLRTTFQSCRFGKERKITENRDIVVMSVHAHDHDLGLSGAQSATENSDEADAGNVKNTGFPWFTVGPSKNHIGYLNQYRNFQHEQYTGTNFLLDALKKLTGQ